MFNYHYAKKIADSITTNNGEPLATDFSNLDGFNVVNFLPYGMSPSQAQSIESTFVDSIDKLVNGLSGTFSQLSTNAIEAEKAAADAANLFSMEMQKDQQRYNSAEAKLAYERSQASAQAQMDFEERMAKEAMAYQTNMANTAYQRAVKDMQAAGINPILAYTQGGASAPAGISAAGSNVSATAATSSAASGVKARASSGYNANVNAIKYKVVGQVVTSAFDLLNSFFK